ncbi:chromosome partitioning protein [Roseateles asaccharophilus]|uniref:ParA family protein n=1 Tax=Roseateles asaccharophilus TaxID=582607 RepID=UPI0038330DE7
MNEADQALAQPATAEQDGVTLEHLDSLSEHLLDMMERLKTEIYKPGSVKQAPNFNAAQLAALCGKSDQAMRRLLDGAEARGLATGLITNASGQKTAAHRSFTVEQAIEWVRAVGTKAYKRKPGQEAAVITVGFFKGGVGKTILASSLAQGLSLMGYKVLVIDFDPQGSMSTMLGVDPATVEVAETFTPIAMPKGAPGHSDNLADSVRPTYWHGIDIIAGNTALFNCEFYLPLRTMNAKQEGTRFNFMEVLARGLKMGLRDEYDYIIIDTPPALSYTTMNAYWAADAILMPVVPEGLSLQSSVQFWSQFSELASVASGDADEPKKYAWLGIVPSRVEGHKTAVQTMTKWIRMFYGQYVMTSELPQTEAVKTGGTEFKTIYDISRASEYIGGSQTYARAREAFDRVINEVDSMTRRAYWHETQGA